VLSPCRPDDRDPAAKPSFPMQDDPCGLSAGSPECPFHPRPQHYPLFHLWPRGIDTTAKMQSPQPFDNSLTHTRDEDGETPTEQEMQQSRSDIAEVRIYRVPVSEDRISCRGNLATWQLYVSRRKAKAVRSTATYATCHSGHKQRRAPIAGKRILRATSGQ
jgi:hypothetical protein